LVGAACLIVCRELGEQIAELIRPNALYESLIGSPEAVERRRLAQEAYVSATRRLKATLPRGVICGRGTHRSTGLRGRVTEHEWADMEADIRNSKLCSPHGSWKDEIENIRIKTSDVIKYCCKAPRRTSIAANVGRCREWFETMMAVGGNPEGTRKSYRDEAMRTFGISGRAVDDARKAAIKNTRIEGRNHLWAEPGRRPK
jgi:hypothetical protein